MINKILDTIGWLGTALVCAGVAVWFLQPDSRELSRGLAIGGLACTLIYILGQWRRIVQVLAGRQAKLGSITTVSIVVVVGILIAINYIASRQSRRWDFTAAKQFSLSEQTRRVLENLDAPVTAKVFTREEEFDRYRLRLDQYSHLTTQLSSEYIDLDREPAAAREYQIQAYGTIVFEYEGRIERVASDLEQDLTNALIKVIEGQEKKVYFVGGHGEKDTGSADRDGYNSIAGALTGDNFTFESLVIGQAGELPADAAVLVVAGPTTDFFPNEIELLRTYLDDGGNALFLIDPPANTDSDHLPNLLNLLEEWNVEIGRNVVVDVSGMGQILGTDATVPVAAQYPPHAITERFSYMTAYPMARSVKSVTSGKASRIAQTFIETGPRSWAETDFVRLTASSEVALEVDQGDVEGPISIGVAITARVNPVDYTPTADPDLDISSSPEESTSATETEIESTGTASSEENASSESDEQEPEPETRITVIGDSDFAANFALGIQGNRDLFLNTVNWLAEQENLIAIRAREPEDRRITLTAGQQQRVNLLAMFIIPGLVIVLGIYNWWQRR